MKRMITLVAACCFGQLSLAQWPTYSTELLADSDYSSYNPNSGSQYGWEVFGSVAINGNGEAVRTRYVDPGTQCQIERRLPNGQWAVISNNHQMGLFNVRWTTPILTEGGVAIIVGDDGGPFVWGRHGFVQVGSNLVRYIQGPSGIGGAGNRYSLLDATEGGNILMITDYGTQNAMVHVYNAEQNRFSESIPYSQCPIKITSPARVNEYGDVVYSADIQGFDSKGFYRLSDGRAGEVSVAGVVSLTYVQFEFINWDGVVSARGYADGQDVSIRWEDITQPGQIVGGAVPRAQKYNLGGIAGIRSNQIYTNAAYIDDGGILQGVEIPGLGTKTVAEILDPIPDPEGFNFSGIERVTANGDLIALATHLLDPWSKMKRYRLVANWGATVSGNLQAGPGTDGDLFPITVSGVGPRGGSARTVLVRPGNNFRIGTQASGSLLVSIPSVNGSLPQSVIVNTNTPGSLATVSLPTIKGDVDRDGEVGPGDFEEVVARFGASVGSSLYTTEADVDRNGEVGPSDFEIIVLNFGLAGS